jgi:hypothetical protein
VVVVILSTTATLMNMFVVIVVGHQVKNQMEM